MYGNHTPTLRNLSLKVLSQIGSSSACEKKLEHICSNAYKTKKSAWLPYAQQLVFCYYNMKLKIHDIQVETDKVAEKNCLDSLDISTEFGEEKDNQLFQWVRPLHLDDEDENPYPRIVAHIRETSVDAKRILFEEVYS